MVKLESTFINMLLALVLVSAFAAAVLGYVYTLTKVPIALSENAKRENSIKNVLPVYDNFPIVERYKSPTFDGDSLWIYPAKQQGKYVGAAVESSTKKGFGGSFSVIIGFNANGTVRGFRMLGHKETPGLGSRIQEWFTGKERKSASVLGLNPSNHLRVKKDGGEVDGITAATVSSRAFLNAVNRAYSALYKVKADAQSGASY